MSPKIEESRVVIRELLEEPPNKFPKSPLEAAPVIESKTPGLSALSAKPPKTAGSKPPIAFVTPDSLSPS